MKRLLWTMPLVLSALFAAAETTGGEREEAVEVDSIEDSELPKKVEVTEAAKVRLVGEGGRVATLELPKGAKVEVTGREGNMLKIVFVKTAGQLDISKTTALDEVLKIRAGNKAAEKERAVKAQIDAAQQKRLQEMEEEKERDISVNPPEQEIPVSEYRRLLLAYPWTLNNWSGKPDYSTPGDVPWSTYTFKKDGTWKSIARYRVNDDGSPAINDMGKWRLEGDKLKLYHSGLRFDPDINLYTLKFVSSTLLKLSLHPVKRRDYLKMRWWTADVEQAE